MILRVLEDTVCNAQRELVEEGLEKRNRGRGIIIRIGRTRKHFRRQATSLSDRSRTPHTYSMPFSVVMYLRKMISIFLRSSSLSSSQLRLVMVIFVV